MQRCNNCLENNWDFKYIDGWIKATCNLCGHEVEFEAKKKNEVNKNCRKCDTELIVKQAKKKPKQLKKKYYYTAYNYCPKCKTIYYNNKYKVFN